MDPDYSQSDSDDSEAYSKASFRSTSKRSAGKTGTITVEDICKRKPYLVKRTDFLNVTLPSIVKLQYSICVAPENSTYGDATKSSIMPPEKECDKMLQKLRMTPSCSVFLPYGLFNQEGIGRFVYCHTMKKTKMMVQAEASWFSDLNLLTRYEVAETISEFKLTHFRDFLADNPYSKVMPLVGSVQATVDDLASLCVNRNYVDTVMIKFIEIANSQQEDYNVLFLNAILTDPCHRGREARIKCFTKFIFVLHLQQIPGDENSKPVIKLAGYDADIGNHFAFCVMTLGDNSADAVYIDTLGLEYPSILTQTLKQFLVGYLQGSAVVNVSLNISFTHYPEDKKIHTCGYDCSVYPKQSCTSLSGAAVMLGVALCVYFPAEFYSLINTKRSQNECASLKTRISNFTPDLSSHARYLRLCMINWLVSGQVKIGNILGEESMKRYTKIKKPANAPDPVQTYIVMTEMHVTSPAVISPNVGSILRMRAAQKKNKSRSKTMIEMTAIKQEKDFDDSSSDVSSIASPAPSYTSRSGGMSLKDKLKNHIKQVKRKQMSAQGQEEPDLKFIDTKPVKRISAPRIAVIRGIPPFRPSTSTEDTAQIEIELTQPVEVVDVTVLGSSKVDTAIAELEITPVNSSSTKAQVTEVARPTGVSPMTVVQPLAVEPVTLSQVITGEGSEPVTITSLTQAQLDQAAGISPVKLSQVNPTPGVQPVIITTHMPTQDSDTATQKTVPLSSVLVSGPAGDGLPLAITEDIEEEAPSSTQRHASSRGGKIGDQEPTSPGVRTRRSSGKMDVDDSATVGTKSQTTQQQQVVEASPLLRTRSGKTFSVQINQNVKTPEQGKKTPSKLTEMTSSTSAEASSLQSGRVMPALLVKTPTGNKIIPLPGVNLDSISSSGVAALPIVPAGTPGGFSTIQTSSRLTLSTTPTVTPVKTGSGKMPNILSRTRRSSATPSKSTAAHQDKNTLESQSISIGHANLESGTFEFPSKDSKTVDVYKLDINGQPVKAGHSSQPMESVPMDTGMSDDAKVLSTSEDTDPSTVTQTLIVSKASSTMQGQEKASKSSSQPEGETSDTEKVLTATNIATVKIHVPPSAMEKTPTTPVQKKTGNTLTTPTGKVLSMSPQLLKLLKDNPNAKVSLPDGRQLKVKWGTDSTPFSVKIGETSASKALSSTPVTPTTPGITTLSGVGTGAGVLSTSSPAVPNTPVITVASTSSKRAVSSKRKIFLQPSETIMAYLTEKPLIVYDSVGKVLVVQAELQAYPEATITKEFPCDDNKLKETMEIAQEFFSSDEGLAWVKEVSCNYRVIMVPKNLKTILRSNPVLQFVPPDKLVLTVAIKKYKSVEKVFPCTSDGFSDAAAMKEVINFVKGSDVSTWLLKECQILKVTHNTPKGRSVKINEVLPFTEEDERDIKRVSDKGTDAWENLEHESENDETPPPVSKVKKSSKVGRSSKAKVKRSKTSVYNVLDLEHPLDASAEMLEHLGRVPYCRFDPEENKLELHVQLNCCASANFSREFPCDGEESVEAVQDFLNGEEGLSWIQSLNGLYRTITVPKNLRSFLRQNPLLKYCEPDKLAILMNTRKCGHVNNEFQCSELGFEDEVAMAQITEFVSGIKVYTWLQEEHGIQTELDFEGVTCLNDVLARPYTLRFTEPASIRLRCFFKHGKVVFKSFPCSAKGLGDEEAMARLKEFVDGPEGLEWAMKNSSYRDAEWRLEWVEAGTLKVGMETRWFFDNFQFDIKNSTNMTNKKIERIFPNAGSLVSVRKSESWGISHRTDETYQLTDEVPPGLILVTRLIDCAGQSSACRTECGALRSQFTQSLDEQYCLGCNTKLFNLEDMYQCGNCCKQSGSKQSWGSIDGQLLCTACCLYQRKHKTPRPSHIIKKSKEKMLEIKHKHVMCQWRMKLVLYSDDLTTWKLFKSRRNDIFHQEEAFQATKRPTQSQRDLWDQQILSAGHASQTSSITKKIQSLGDENVSLKRIRSRVRRIKQTSNFNLPMTSGRKAIRKRVKFGQNRKLAPKVEVLEVEESEQEDDTNVAEEIESQENVEYDGQEVVPETIDPALETISAEALAQISQGVEEQKIVILQDHMLCSMCIAQKMDPPYTCSSSEELFKHTSKVHCIKMYSCTTCWSQGALVSFDSEHDLTSHVTARHALSGTDLRRQLEQSASTTSGAKGHTMSEEVLSAIDSIINADEFVTVQEQQLSQNANKRKIKVEDLDPKRVCTQGDLLRCAECSEECNARAMCCDNCHSWYHWHCISFTQDQTNGKWFCLRCLPV